jgi:hypothetical protein
MPIRAGFGQTAAFTLDQGETLKGRSLAESRDILQLVGLYFHAYVSARTSSFAFKPLVPIPVWPQSFDFPADGISRVVGRQRPIGFRAPLLCARFHILPFAT